MKTHLFLKIFLLFTTLGFASNLKADEVGLAVGDQAAPFKLNDQAGNKVSLADLTAEHGNVALVFYRSADWCPYCKNQVAGLEENRATLEAAGLTLVGISYDSVNVIERFSKEKSIGFTMLSDPGSTTIDAYKIRNTKVRPGRAEGIPHPTIFLVNKEGKITAKLREENFRERPTIEAIVAAAKKMGS